MEPVKRPEILSGATYKIFPPTIESSIYITINNAEINGQIRPIEVFFNSKHVDSHEWTTCVSRMLSALFRQPGEFPQYAVQEMMETMSPKGGYIIPKSKGKSVGSVIGHIGWIIERHCKDLGIWKERI